MDKREVLQNLFSNMDALGKAMSGRSLGQPIKGMPTRAQIGVLFVISYQGPQSIKDLAAKFNMTSSAATQLVNGLVKENLLSREEDLKDRRQIIVDLTSKGREKMAVIKKKRYERMSKIFGTLSIQELLQLQKIQEKIISQAKLICQENHNK